MSIQFLRQVAAMPLPKAFTSPKDIDAVKILRQAGLVIAKVGEPPECGAQVIAITEKGNAELLRFHYPARNAPDASTKPSWLHLAASRARSIIHKKGGAGTERF
ncbi:hypothetical protein [Variovorax sp. LT1R16]|uniref:hypothetical protein n=1 Tax=Variovorax sp. LT1R16 TaxID=3443728 RepID=UPI003F445985